MFIYGWDLNRLEAESNTKSYKMNENVGSKSFTPPWEQPSSVREQKLPSLERSLIFHCSRNAGHAVAKLPRCSRCQLILPHLCPRYTSTLPISTTVRTTWRPPATSWFTFTHPKVDISTIDPTLNQVTSLGTGDSPPTFVQPKDTAPASPDTLQQISWNRRTWTWWS